MSTSCYRVVIIGSGFGGLTALLPRSVSRAIARLRLQLSTGVRGAVISSGNLTALRRWLDTAEGQDDREAWLILHDSSRASPVIRAGAAGHLAGIDLEFG